MAISFVEQVKLIRKKEFTTITFDPKDEVFIKKIPLVALYLWNAQQDWMIGFYELSHMCNYKGEVLVR